MDHEARLKSMRIQLIVQEEKRATLLEECVRLAPLLRTAPMLPDPHLPH